MMEIESVTIKYRDGTETKTTAGTPVSSESLAKRKRIRLVEVGSEQKGDKQRING